MGQITLSSISWSVPLPESAKPVSIAYRLTSDPDVPASYIIVSSGTFVSETGIFSIPFVITGLDVTKEYTVKVTSLCGGFSAEQDFTYAANGSFSVGFSLGFES
jgi:hypothetical protein